MGSIGIRHAKVRIETDRLREIDKRLIVVAKLCIGPAAVRMRVGVFRFELQGSGVVSDREIVLALFAIFSAAIAVNQSVIGLEPVLRVPPLNVVLVAL